MRLSANPKKFKDWPQLRYDILFNGLTIIQAAEKYSITTAGISQHLKKYPRIKQAYYDRSWAERQLKLEFLNPECRWTREVIDDYYANDYPPIHQFDKEQYREALQHRERCRRCQDYEKYLIQRAEAPYRIDCPPIVKLVRHLRPHHEEIITKTRKRFGSENDVSITEHLLVCNFCRAELYQFHIHPLKDVIPLMDREEKLYPKNGWREYLSSDALEQIQAVAKLHPDFRDVDLTVLDSKAAKFIKWRRFRRWTMQPGTL